MIELLATKSSSTTFALAVGAVVFASPPSYPARVEPYEVQQVRGTYSNFMENLLRPSGVEQFAKQMTSIFESFSKRQERLGAEFEAAIFSDLESLYEA